MGPEPNDVGPEASTFSKCLADWIFSLILPEDLQRNKENFRVSSSIVVWAPHHNRRASRPQAGRIAFNTALLRLGVRLPLHPFIHDILEVLDLSPTQLTPNSYRLMLGSYVAWRIANDHDLTPREFFFLFTVKQSSGAEGYYFLTKWSDIKEHFIRDLCLPILARRIASGSFRDHLTPAFPRSRPQSSSDRLSIPE